MKHRCLPIPTFYVLLFLLNAFLPSSYVAVLLFHVGSFATFYEDLVGIFYLIVPFLSSITRMICARFSILLFFVVSDFFCFD